MTKLEVLVSTYGSDGIFRIASGGYPVVDGVAYLVGWQGDGNTAIPESLRDRDDIRIIRMQGKGLSRSRNELLDEAAAPLLLFADDDLEYNVASLRRLINESDAHPETDLFLMRHESAFGKIYPAVQCNLSGMPRGWYPSSIEIAVRRERLPKDVRFDTDFGVGSGKFICGEEELWLHDALKSGMNGIFLPIEICRHDGETTGTRNAAIRERIMAKGAVIKRLHPFSWPLRMLRHLLTRRGKISFREYLTLWLRGATARAGEPPQDNTAGEA